MNARIAGAALLTLTVGVLVSRAGEESPHEQAIKQSMRSLDKITAILASVTDAETATAARPDLRKAAVAWNDAKKKTAEIPPPDQAEKDRLVKGYKTKMDETLKKFFTEAGRVRGFRAGKEALQEIKSVTVP
jgi:hypothetical protein